MLQQQLEMTPIYMEAPVLLLVFGHLQYTVSSGLANTSGQFGSIISATSEYITRLR